MAAKLLALVLPLGLDTFAVAAALGMGGLEPRRRLRTSLLFTGFEAGMPLIGVALGRPLGTAIGSVADYVAIGVLAALSAHMLLSDSDESLQGSWIGRGFWPTVALGVSVSLDELAIGFTLGLLGLPVIPVILLIAVQAFCVTQLGIRLGDRVSVRLRERAERLAGVALGVLAIVLLVVRLSG